MITYIWVGFGKCMSKTVNQNTASLYKSITFFIDKNEALLKIAITTFATGLRIWDIRNKFKATDRNSSSEVLVPLFFD